MDLNIKAKLVKEGILFTIMSDTYGITEKDVIKYKKELTKMADFVYAILQSKGE